MRTVPKCPDVTNCNTCVKCDPSFITSRTPEPSTSSLQPSESRRRSLLKVSGILFCPLAFQLCYLIIMSILFVWCNSELFSWLMRVQYRSQQSVLRREHLFTFYVSELKQLGSYMPVQGLGELVNSWRYSESHTGDGPLLLQQDVVGPFGWSMWDLFWTGCPAQCRGS